MSGVRKAAIVLMALGSKEASAVLKHLPREEVDSLALEIANLRQVDTHTETQVLREFGQLRGQGQGPEGGLDYARMILEGAFDPSQAKEILHRLTSFMQSRPFEKLARAEAAQVAHFVMGEHPQTIAVVLAHMDPAQASMVLSGLPGELQSDVARRIALLDRVPPEVLKDLAAQIEKKLFSTEPGEDLTRAGGINSIVPILNNTDRSSERAIMRSLAEMDPELADEIQNRMFVFENMVQLDDGSVQKVLRRIDQKVLALALKGAAPEVVDKILKNLSNKARDLLKDDIEVLGPVRIRDVEQAQREILNVVRSLEDQGEIVVARGDRDEFVV